jgi:hypothetical protein
MAADDREIQEERVRIVCHLPLNNAAQERAILDVFEYLKESKKTGWIHSQHYPPIFSGWWWSEERQDWVRDRVVVCTVDYMLDDASPSVASPSMKIREIRDEIQGIYKRRTGEPRAFWMVAHVVTRHDSRLL